MLLLYEIEVAAAHRRRGVGQSMLQLLSRISRETGAYKTWTLTDAANDASRAFYRSAGAEEACENLLIVWRGTQLGS